MGTKGPKTRTHPGPRWVLGCSLQEPQQGLEGAPESGRRCCCCCCCHRRQHELGHCGEMWCRSWASPQKQCLRSNCRSTWLRDPVVL